MWDVAIIGGGASGTLLAAGLMRCAEEPFRVILIEARGPHGLGVAYRTERLSHLLNVPAGRMSAFEEEPFHFLHWLQQRDTTVGLTDFVPRRHYGDYLQSLLEQSVRPGLRLALETGEVRTLSVLPDRIEVGFAIGEQIQARTVVLATGPGECVPLAVPDGGLYQSARYLGSAWDERFRDIHPDEPVLFLGTGLTTVDAVLALTERGHRAPLQALSRHGLLPRAHRPASGSSSCAEVTPGMGLRALVREVRRASRRHDAGGESDWRLVVDGLRRQTPALWQGLTRVEQHRFLRHVRPYWEVHRHRMAPQVAAVIQRLRGSEQLRLHAGRFRSFRPLDNSVAVDFISRGMEKLATLRVARVVNCMGPAPSLRQTQSPLLRGLLKQGWVRPDALGLGLDATEDGRLIDASGVPSSRLFTLGPLLRGTRWETTAIPEIRAQAGRLAALLTQEKPGAVL